MERFFRTARYTLKDTAIVAVIMVAFTSFIQITEAEEHAGRVDTALVFVVDASSSMTKSQLQFVRKSHAEAITSPEVMEAIGSGYFGRSAFAFVEFSARSAVIVEWMIIDSPETAATFAWQILHNERSNLGELTGIGAGFTQAFELMGALPAEPLYRVIDVVGDGKPNTGLDPAPVRDLIIDAGVTINGMPMLDSTYEDIEEYYAQEIIGGARAFSIPLDKMQDMPTLLRRKLVIEIG